MLSGATSIKKPAIRPVWFAFLVAGSVLAGRPARASVLLIPGLSSPWLRGVSVSGQIEGGIDANPAARPVASISAIFWLTTPTRCN